jgi:hypothetical protein
MKSQRKGQPTDWLVVSVLTGVALAAIAFLLAQ